MFDAHVFEVYTSLIHGHRLYITSNKIRTDLLLLIDYLDRNAIFIATIPPALLTNDTILSLSTIVVAGEISNLEIMTKYHKNGIHVINAYGPTENDSLRDSSSL